MSVLLGPEMGVTRGTLDPQDRPRRAPMPFVDLWGLF